MNKDSVTLRDVQPEDLEFLNKLHNDPNTILGGFDFNGIVFLTSLDDESCVHALHSLGLQRCLIVRDAQSLKLANGHILVSFGTSLIVPTDILDHYAGGVYNIHAASPDYPGRDPHHWAAYDRVNRYGATAHIMTSKVDDGPIVDVEWFDVSPGTRPEELLKKAN